MDGIREKQMPVTSKPVKGGVAVTVTCDVCGCPIIGANEYGMYCKNRCLEEKNKKASKKLRDLLNTLEGTFGLGV